MAKNTEFQAFIEKAMKRKEELNKPFEIDVKTYGKMTFNRPTNNQLIEYMDKVGQATKTAGEGEEREVVGQDFRLMVESAKELVYVCCPDLQSKELQEKMGIQDPMETPLEVFGINETLQVAIEISNRADGAKIQEEMDSTVKN